jgi:BirA family biotin operon repressor/biotin-[acetyl-CoA-carboxylase] ligase
MRIAQDVTGPTWILAHEQTAGRGRQGRPWRDPKGNLAVSLLLFPNETPDTFALRSFVVSLALYRTCAVLTGQGDKFALKWPNDVLLEGRKMAGILLETTPLAGGKMALIIGIGVNLAHAPETATLEARALAPVSVQEATGHLIAPEAFLNQLAEEYERLEHQFQTGGFAPIREAWLAHAAKLGEVITARTTKSETIGLFDTIDETGHLVLQTSDGAKRIAAADIYF